MGARGRPRDRAAERDEEKGVYIISVAAELAGVHPQTLRIYERKGLLSPARTKGNTRRYSQRDIERLQMIQKLTQDFGINLAGVKMIVEMENELDRLRARVQQMDRELPRARRRMQNEIDRLRQEAKRGEIVPLSTVQGWRLQMRGQPRGKDQPRRGPIAMGPPE